MGGLGGREAAGVRDVRSLQNLMWYVCLCHYFKTRDSNSFVLLHILPNKLLAPPPAEHLSHALLNMPHELFQPKRLRPVFVVSEPVRGVEHVVHEAEADVARLVVVVDLAADEAQAAHAVEVDFEEVHFGERKRAGE